MNTLKNWTIFLVLLMFCITPAHAGGKEKIDASVKAAQSWLKLVDEKQYAQSWEEAASFFKDHVTKEQLTQQFEKVHGAMGDLVKRTLKTAEYSTSLPGAPDGEYVVIQFETTFKNKKNAIETVTPMLDKDGQWRVSGYFIK